MCDLITGKTKETKFDFEDSAVSCSNEKSLFVISVAEDKSKKKVISIETYHIISYTNFIRQRKIWNVT